MRFVCARVVLPLLAVPLLWGCSGTSSPDGPSFTAVPEPWRAVEEQACLSSGIVHESSFLRGRSALGGPSVCGAEKPFEMAAADNGRVQMNPPALLRCPMIPQVDPWVRNVVEPAALRRQIVDAVPKFAKSVQCLDCGPEGTQELPSRAFR